MQRFLNHGNAEWRVMEKSGKGTRCRGNPRELLAREKGESSFVDGVASDIDPMKFRDGQKSKFATNSESVYSRIAY
jgi:hypothetical protein